MKRRSRVPAGFAVARHRIRLSILQLSVSVAVNIWPDYHFSEASALQSVVRFPNSGTSIRFFGMEGEVCEVSDSALQRDGIMKATSEQEDL